MQLPDSFIKKHFEHAAIERGNASRVVHRLAFAVAVVDENRIRIGHIELKDLEYIGNVPHDRWDSPPPEVLRHLGLD